MTILVLTVLICCAICAVLTNVVRRHAITRDILDHPNDRSSHVVPTPRGGGLAIVLSVLGVTLVLALYGRIDFPLAIAVLGGGGAIALIGWLDDLGKAPVSIRLAVQVLAALGAVIALGGMSHPVLLTAPTNIGWIGSALAVIGIVWCTNLYNFMDGIDGLAASEASIVSGVGTVLAFLSHQTGISLILAAVAGSASGFLYWNWQPARIFMGDVGSGFIGFVLALCVIALQRDHTMSIAIWFVLLIVFLADSTITLLRRMLAGESLHIAHRTHAYQRAVQAGFTHWQVTGAILAMNILLATFAIVMWQRPERTLIFSTSAVVIVGTAYWIVERKHPMYPRSRTQP